MPVLPPLKETTRSIYGLEFAPDGFPVKREGDERPVANPIFGKYAIQDFLLQADQTDDPRFVEAAAAVGRAALARMEPFQDSLVFWYPEDIRPVRNRRPHYSGLTQSHYLVVFDRLARATGSREFAGAAHRVLRSLQIPVEEGGVLYRRGYGSIIAETPCTPNDVVLNGWLTAMVNVHEYAEAADSEEARDLFADNLSALRAVIEQFDVPALRNSRYGSAGFAYFRLMLPPRRPGADPYQIADLALAVPEEGTYAIGAAAGDRWQLYAFEKDVEIATAGGLQLGGRQLRLNLVLNLLPFPQPNELVFTVSGSVAGTCTLQMRFAGYNPLATAPNHQPRWIDVASAQLDSGHSPVRLPIPWEHADLVAYPTSFLKRVDGDAYNVYHFLHIDQLRRLHRLTGDPLLLEIADRWTSYVEEWATMDVYESVRHAPSPHRGHPYK